jgi:hypothetical protein
VIRLALDLHNVESRESRYHVFCAQAHPEGERSVQSRALTRHIAAECQRGGFAADSTIRGPGYMSSRLAWWLGQYYGALPILYEFNSQSPARHLTPGELRELGGLVVRGAVKHLAAGAAADKVARSPNEARAEPISSRETD